MKTLKKLISLVMVLATLATVLPLSTIQVSAVTRINESALSVRNTVISNSVASEYVNKVMTYYLTKNARVINDNLNVGKSVVFFFDGCSDNVFANGFNYATNHMSAYCAVVKLVNGIPTIVYENENSSTIPDNPRMVNSTVAGNYGTDVPTVVDGIHNISLINHQGSYAALHIYDSGSSVDVVRCNNNTYYSATSAGINAHARGWNYVSTSTYSSTGCFNIGLSSPYTEYNDFIYAVTGKTNARNSKFSTVGTDVGIVIVDRYMYRDTLSKIYNDSTLVDKITKHSIDLNNNELNIPLSKPSVYVNYSSFGSGGVAKFTFNAPGASRVVLGIYKDTNLLYVGEFSPTALYYRTFYETGHYSCVIETFNTAGQSISSDWVGWDFNAIDTSYPAEPTTKPSISYTGYTEKNGWVTQASDGSAITSASGDDFQAFAIKLNNCDGGIIYDVHLSELGWKNGYTNGATAGVTNNTTDIEAVRINLTGKIAEKYNVYYRVSAEDNGWLGWAKNGDTAGTLNGAKHITGLQIELVPKVTYSAHVEEIGWQSAVYDGAIAGTIGENAKIEAVKISLADLSYGSIGYNTHIAEYGWGVSVYNGKTSGTTGVDLQAEAFQVALTGTAKEKFDVLYSAHIEEKGWMSYVKNGATAGTTGQDLQLEAFKVLVVPKGYDSSKSSYVEYKSDGSDVTAVKITFNANGGKASYSSRSYSYLNRINDLPTATRDGYTFDGWYTSASGGTKVVLNQKLLQKTAFTVYAHWTKAEPNTYTVTYNANGGTGAPSAQTKYHDSTLTLSSTKPTRPGYTFLGWATSANATTAQYQPGASYTANSNVVLYAVWQKNAVTLNSISISSLPTKTVYVVGESLNTNGLKLKLTYSDGSTKEVTSGFTTSGFNSSSAGTKTVTVTYEGKTTTFKVTVNPAPVTDENSPQLIVDSVTARAGDEVKVNISLKNNPGIASLKLNVAYGSGLTLTNVKYNDAIGGASQAPQALSSPVTLNWYNGAANTNGDFVFATLTFKVSQAAASGTTNGITVTYNKDDVYNIAEKNIDLAVKNGGVTVASYTPGDINGDGSVNNKDLTRLFQYLSGWNVEVDSAALDVNGDGSVNNKDLTRLFQYLSGWNVEIH